MRITATWPFYLAKLTTLPLSHNIFNEKKHHCQHFFTKTAGGSAVVAFRPRGKLEFEGEYNTELILLCSIVFFVCQLVALFVSTAHDI